jgi:hypothetical protein
LPEVSQSAAALARQIICGSCGTILPIRRSAACDPPIERLIL